MDPHSKAKRSRIHLYGLPENINSKEFSNGFLTNRGESPPGILNKKHLVMMRPKKLKDYSTSSLNASSEKEVPLKYSKLFDRQFLNESVSKSVAAGELQKDAYLNSQPTDSTKMSSGNDRMNTLVKESSGKHAKLKNIPPLKYKKVAENSYYNLTQDDKDQLSDRRNTDDMVNNEQLRKR